MTAVIANLLTLRVPEIANADVPALDDVETLEPNITTPAEELF